MSDKDFFQRSHAATASVVVSLLLAACGGDASDQGASGAQPKSTRTQDSAQITRGDTHHHAPIADFTPKADAATLRQPDAAPLGYAGNRLDSHATGPARSLPLRGVGATRGSSCDVDFNDTTAKTMTGPSAWMDRIYVPWFQTCATGRVDVRPTVLDHVHLGFTNFNVADCLLESPDGAPMKRVDGVCQLVDIPSEPRDDLYTHLGNEVLMLRTYSPDATQYQRTNFDLQRIRIRGSQPVRLCYRGSLLEEIVQGGQPADPWDCFESLSPGYYDLSNWVVNAYEVTITGATFHPFSIDDLRLAFRAAQP